MRWTRTVVTKWLLLCVISVVAVRGATIVDPVVKSEGQEVYLLENDDKGNYQLETMIMEGEDRIYRYEISNRGRFYGEVQKLSPDGSLEYNEYQNDRNGYRVFYPVTEFQRVPKTPVGILGPFAIRGNRITTATNILDGCLSGLEGDVCKTQDTTETAQISTTERGLNDKRVQQADKGSLSLIVVLPIRNISEANGTQDSKCPAGLKGDLCRKKLETYGAESEETELGSDAQSDPPIDWRNDKGFTEQQTTTLIINFLKNGCPKGLAADLCKKLNSTARTRDAFLQGPDPETDERNLRSSPVPPPVVILDSGCPTGFTGYLCKTRIEPDISQSQNTNLRTEFERRPESYGSTSKTSTESFRPTPILPLALVNNQRCRTGFTGELCLTRIETYIGQSQNTDSRFLRKNDFLPETNGGSSISIADYIPEFLVPPRAPKQRTIGCPEGLTGDRCETTYVADSGYTWGT